jgi:hypothetical protein
MDNLSLLSALAEIRDIQDFRLRDFMSSLGLDERQQAHFIGNCFLLTLNGYLKWSFAEASNENNFWTSDAISLYNIMLLVQVQVVTSFARPQVCISIG